MGNSNAFMVILFSLEILGTVVFALTGTIKAIKCKLDLLGVIVLSSLVGVGGGMIRDVIIGATPVAALENEIYIIVCFLVGIVFFFLAPYLSSEINIIQYADAIGLGVFTFTGAAKAANMDLSLVGIVFSGTITAVGGGVLRDTLMGEIPAVLRSDFYATASILGGFIFCLLSYLNFPFIIIFIIVSSIVIALRLVGISLKIQLPTSHFKNHID